MDHNVAEAQEHLATQDSIVMPYPHQCTTCEDGFDHGHGVKISDEKFCKDCVKGFKHHEFYQRECGMSVKEANLFIESNTKEI